MWYPECVVCLYLLVSAIVTGQHDLLLPIYNRNDNIFTKTPCFDLTVCVCALFLCVHTRIAHDYCSNKRNKYI